MLIETKVKISKEIDNKLRKYSTVFLTDSENLLDAIATVMAHLNRLHDSEEISDAELISCKQSSIKEVATQFEGEKSYIATLKDIWVDEVSGEEKAIRYKVLLYADDLTICNENVQQLSREGYDMLVESLTEMDMEYLELSETTEDDTIDGEQV